MGPADPVPCRQTREIVQLARPFACALKLSAESLDSPNVDAGVNRRNREPVRNRQMRIDIFAERRPIQIGVGETVDNPVTPFAHRFHPL